MFGVMNLWLCEGDNAQVCPMVHLIHCWMMSISVIHITVGHHLDYLNTIIYRYEWSESDDRTVTMSQMKLTENVLFQERIKNCFSSHAFLMKLKRKGRHDWRRKNWRKTGSELRIYRCLQFRAIFYFVHCKLSVVISLKAREESYAHRQQLASVPTSDVCGFFVGRASAQLYWRYFRGRTCLMCAPIICLEPFFLRLPNKFDYHYSR